MEKVDDTEILTGEAGTAGGGRGGTGRKDVDGDGGDGIIPQWEG